MPIDLNLLKEYTNICVISGVLQEKYFLTKKKLYVKLKTEYGILIRLKLPIMFKNKINEYLGKKVIAFGSLFKYKEFNKELNRYIPELAVNVKNLEIIIYDL